MRREITSYEEQLKTVDETTGQYNEQLAELEAKTAEARVNMLTHYIV